MTLGRKSIQSLWRWWSSLLECEKVSSSGTEMQASWFLSEWESRGRRMYICTLMGWESRGECLGF